MRKSIEKFICPSHGIVINTNIVKKEWKEKYDELINFIVANRRFPRSRKCTEYEYNLNLFFTKEYDLYYENTFSKERKEFFEQIILISNEIKKEKWVEVIKDIIVFILCNSKFPKKSKNEFENKLADRTSILIGYYLNEQSRKENLDELNLELKDFMNIIYKENKKAYIFSDFEKLELFIILNGKYPDFNSINPIEQQLSKFLSENTNLYEHELLLKFKDIYNTLSFKLDDSIEELKKYTIDFDNTKHLEKVRGKERFNKKKTKLLGDNK